MFFPLGLGNGLVKLPIIIILLVFGNIAFSIQSFPDVFKYQQSIKELIDSKDVQSLTAQVAYKACLVKFNSPICNSRMKKLIKPELLKKFDVDLKLNKKLTHDLITSTKFLDLFKGHPSRWPKMAQQFPEYKTIMEFYSEKKEIILKAAKTHNLLTPKNISITSLLKAGFIHGSFLHLAGNMLLLIIFGLSVEKALGAGLTFLTFILGSYCGVFVEVLTMQDVNILLGASAGVSAMLGVFLILFWKAQMKFLFTMFPFYFKTLYLPVAITVPFMFIAADILGALSRNTGSSNVAHLAHLGGLFVGILIAFLFRMTSQVKFPFLFETENEIYQQAKHELSATTRLSLLLSLRKWNWQNAKSCYQALKVGTQLDLSSTQKSELTLWTDKLLDKELHGEKYNQALPLLELAIQNTLDSKALSSFSPAKVQNLADRSLALGKFDLSLKLYRTLLGFKHSKLDYSGIEKTCQNIEEHLKVNRGERSEYSQEIRESS